MIMGIFLVQMARKGKQAGLFPIPVAGEYTPDFAILNLLTT